MSDFRQQLKQVDFKRYLKKSDAQGAWMLLMNYIIIVFAFALAALWTNALTIFIALILLGNRQLGLGILMHDCVHGALFKRKSLNKWCGEFLFASPILAQFEGYRRYHLQHHAKAGTAQDPDYPNYQHYPVSSDSLRRKLLRDIFGITGAKNLYILMLMHSGLLTYDMSYQSSKAEHTPSVLQIVGNLARNLCLPLLFHALLFLVLWSFQQPWLYVLWWIAYFTTFMLFSRIRNAAEHASVPDLLNEDPRLHARTVYARWWEKLTVAPNHVNYHLEHHWLPSVPPYQLSAFHRALKNEGLLKDVNVLKGYGQVLKALTN